MRINIVIRPSDNKASPVSTVALPLQHCASELHYFRGSVGRQHAKCGDGGHLADICAFPTATAIRSLATRLLVGGRPVDELSHLVTSGQ